MAMRMVAWVHTSQDWKIAFYDADDIERADVYEPRTWWRLWHKRASEAVRQEVLAQLRCSDDSA